MEETELIQCPVCDRVALLEYQNFLALYPYHLTCTNCGFSFIRRFPKEQLERLVREMTEAREKRANKTPLKNKLFRCFKK